MHQTKAEPIRFSLRNSTLGFSGSRWSWSTTETEGHYKPWKLLCIMVWWRWPSTIEKSRKWVCRRWQRQRPVSPKDTTLPGVWQLSGFKCESFFMLGCSQISSFLPENWAALWLSRLPTQRHLVRRAREVKPSLCVLVTKPWPGTASAQVMCHFMQFVCPEGSLLFFFSLNFTQD